MSYNAKVYRKQGGNEMVVASGGTITVESGGTIAISGSLSIGSGGSVAYSSGANPVMPVQTVSSSATTISAGGYSQVTGSTVGPTYLIANPIAGVMKFIELVPGTSAATQRAVIAPASTGVSFTTTGKNNVTLATSALRQICLVGKSTSAYRCFGVFTSTMAGFGNVTT